VRGATQRGTHKCDSLGQVVSGRKYWIDGTPVAGQQSECAFDDIGNRTSTKAGGDANGAKRREAGCQVNYLSQYTSRTVPGALDILGTATNTATGTGTLVARRWRVPTSPWLFVIGDWLLQ
jgi:hypothetical protein